MPVFTGVGQNKRQHALTMWLYDRTDVPFSERSQKLGLDPEDHTPYQRTTAASNASSVRASVATSAVSSVHASVATSSAETPTVARSAGSAPHSLPSLTSSHSMVVTPSIRTSHGVLPRHRDINENGEVLSATSLAESSVQGPLCLIEAVETGDEQMAPYECPNRSALKCDFHTGDLETLKTHTLAHFCKAQLPRRAKCPFRDCGEVFETRVEGSAHNRSAADALHARTRHVVKRHYEAGDRLSREAWDHDLVTHFWKVNVISDDEYVRTTSKVTGNIAVPERRRGRRLK
ncbi:hypothetical protein EJ06DRAFT_525566 [Trichodelitschia bisporula]|uniref:Uncharacterized protein n=1 Tax=Trichodelitschia bisporula TaxID=703511 RepID=A0A6G1I9M9_9PEZI|nr:hypothetical protein EJ06DRAFT_525566 [Trichodelitschia bisporula]